MLTNKFRLNELFIVGVSCDDCTGMTTVTELTCCLTEQVSSAEYSSQLPIPILNNRIEVKFSLLALSLPLSIRIRVRATGNAARPLHLDVSFTQGSEEVWKARLHLQFIEGKASIETTFPIGSDAPAVSPRSNTPPQRLKDLDGAMGSGMFIHQGIRFPESTKVRFGSEVGDVFKYRVWFATTRQPRQKDSRIVDFTSSRDDASVHYGSCVVRIPKSHIIGTLGSAWWKRVLSGKDDRVTLRKLTIFSENEHWRTLRAQMQSAPDGERDAVVYLHGFHVSFADAALRAAQLGFDLQIRGAMAFFSWPSRGTLKGYWADEATIEANEEAITTYLLGFSRHVNATRVHVIAHSMGNRALLRAIQRILATVQRISRVRFGQLILAAPDVDAQVFRDLAKAYRRIASRTTLYVSSKDKAVAASVKLHGAPRVGLAPPVTTCPGVDTVHVTNVDTSLIGHGYIAESREIVTDVFALIRYDAPPESRLGLRPVVTEDGQKYWVIAP